MEVEVEVEALVGVELMQVSFLAKFLYGASFFLFFSVEVEGLVGVELMQVSWGGGGNLFLLQYWFNLTAYLRSWALIRSRASGFIGFRTY